MEEYSPLVPSRDWQNTPWYWLLPPLSLLLTLLLLPHGQLVHLSSFYTLLFLEVDGCLYVEMGSNIAQAILELLCSQGRP